MSLDVKKQREIQPVWEGVELCRYYYKSEKISFGTSTLDAGEAGEIDPGHPNSQEIFYVIKGCAKVCIPGKEEHFLNEGDAILIPEGLPHQLMNPGNSTSVIGWSIAPGLKFD